MSATHVPRPLRASLLMLGAGALLSLMVAFAKLAAETHSIVEVTFFRNLVGTICMTFVIASNPRGFAILKTDRPMGHVVRGVLGLTGLMLNLWAAKLLPLADAAALFFAMPLLLTVLSIPLLSEKVDWRRWVGVILGFVGILIIARPTGDTNVLGVIVALAGAGLTAFVAIAIRRLGTTEPEIRTVFYFFSLSAIISGCMLPWFWTMPTSTSLIWLVGAGLAGTFGQILLTKAYAEAAAAFLSPFNYVSIVYSTAFGWLIWGEWPHMSVFIGSVIVIGAGLLTIALERTRKKPEQEMLIPNG